MNNATLAKQLISILLAVVLSPAASAALARNSSTHISKSRTDAFAPEQKAISARPALLPTPTPSLNGYIAFTHYGNSSGFGVEQIATLDEDGSNLTTLTSGVHAEDAAWSPDSSKIAFSIMYNNSFQIWVMNSDGSQQTCLTNNSQRSDDEPTWSPDGTRIAFVGDDQIWAINADGTNEVKLSDGTTVDDYPDWSPDGSKIVFTKDAMSGNAQTYTMNVDGSNLVNLSSNTWAERDPAWSPDGSKIAYYSFQDGHYEIYVMNADGSEPTQLTKTDYNVSNQEPSWSPDGTKIAFMSNRDDNNAEIYVMDADGSQQTRLTNDAAYDSHPCWGSYVPPPPPTPTPTPAELSLSATVDPASVASGETVLYEINTSNNGPATATAVQLSCLLPAGVSLTNINNGYGSCTNEPDESSGGTRVDCTLGDIPNSQAKLMTLTATATGTPDDWLQATMSVSSDSPETFNGNNFAYPAITILGAPEANMWLNASAQPSVVTPGETITFSSTIHNNGPYQATGATISTTFPSGLTVDTAATLAGDCTLTPLSGGSTTVTCPLGDINIFGKQTTTISATVNTTNSANLVASIAVGSTLPDPYTLDNTVNVQFLVRPSSPGPSSKLAFTSYRDGNAEIYLTNADGSETLNLTGNQASDLEPAWSPDGSKIVFNSDRSGTTEVWLMDADGSNPAQLTTNGSNGAYFSWSPDGTKITWQDYKEGNYDICIVNADGTDFRNLTDDTNYQSRPQWSPDSEKLIYEDYGESGSEVFVINADGTGKTNLSNSPDTSDYAPVWSPDGTKIGFARGYGNSNQGIYVMNADGSNQVNLTNTDDDGYPSWSPDGSKIAFSRLLNYTQMIYVMNADGSNQEPVFVGNYTGGSKPEWSPDATGLLFETVLDGNSEIYAVNVDGSGLTNTSSNGANDFQARWQPVANTTTLAQQ